MDKYRPGVFGEVLWDVFPEGEMILGGAPFNVAWHLCGFGLAPLFISRVGEDELGQRVREKATAWGLDDRGLQRDPRHPTGRVQVDFPAHGEPTYTITPEQAFDFIAASPAAAVVRQVAPPLLYHGTLGRRHPTAAAALAALTATPDLPVFVDLNLRPPWWQPATVHDVLDRARWCKLNAAELDQLSVEDGSRGLEERARRFRARHDLQALFVTQGAAGALAVAADDHVVRAPAVVAEPFADTVGAGDGFAAVALLGLLEDWPLAVLLRRANAFAAELCRQTGATAFNPDLYARARESWNDES